MRRGLLTAVLSTNNLTSRNLSLSRCCVKQIKDKKQISFNVLPPTKTNNNWIGPPNTLSNLRPIKFHIPADETSAETDYRIKRQNLQEWNQNFWANHNVQFFTLKEQFISNKIGSNTHNEDGTEKSLSAEELSQFYQKFLNENHRKHWDYNKEWYRKNIGMLLPALNAKLSRWSLIFKRSSRKTEQ